QLDKTQALRLTSTGALMGSPLYMSPEQAKGDPVDFRADIWGMTAVLYEAVTGKQPFPGTNYNAVLCAIMLKEPERPAQEIGLDEELWSLIQRGLAKEPEFRYESMRHFGQALARWLVECGEQTDITGASLITQWLANDQPADQLTTVYPPTAEVRIESIERNAPTQRLSRDPGLAAVSQRSRVLARRRMFVAAAAAGGLIGALALGWAAFGAGSAEPASTEPPQAEAPAAQPPKATQIRASEPAEPPQDSDGEPAVTDAVGPTPAAADASPESVAEKPATTPEPDATVKPKAPSRVRQTSVNRPVSGKRTSKLKNPFAP
ncbi:MAG TPA: protein kinase, partial [Polyangiaceae bacterium]|nr:protein kinase [Polyangiaceae bacterium]